METILNGVCLCSNCHDSFDSGWLYIEESPHLLSSSALSLSNQLSTLSLSPSSSSSSKYTIRTRAGINDTYPNSLNGKSLRMPNRRHSDFVKYNECFPPIGIWSWRNEWADKKFQSSQAHDIRKNNIVAMGSNQIKCKSCDNRALKLCQNKEHNTDGKTPLCASCCRKHGGCIKHKS